MQKKLLLFYCLISCFIYKETYASNTQNRERKEEIKIETSQEEKIKYKGRFYFFLGNLGIATGLLNFNNNNLEYIFIEKWDLKLGLYFGIANLGLGLRINDSLLIRILGLNILEGIPMLCMGYQNYKKKMQEYKIEEEYIVSEEEKDNKEDVPPLDKPHISNKEQKDNYILALLYFYFFNIISIEIRLAKYWCFNINFTQTIVILLKELKFL